MWRMLPLTLFCVAFWQAQSRRQHVALSTGSLVAEQPCFKENTRWVPDGMAGQANSNDGAIACQTRCSKVAGCVHFSVYELNSQVCSLHNSDAQENASSGATSGPSTCSGLQTPKCNASFRLHKKMTGKSVKHKTKESSADACQKRCAQTTGCAYFTYQQPTSQAGGWCYVKAASAQETERDSWWSGPANCVAVTSAPLPPPPSTNYKFLHLGDCEKGFMQTIEKTSLAACSNMCSKEEAFGCGKFVHDDTSKKCSLYRHHFECSAQPSNAHTKNIAYAMKNFEPSDCYHPARIQNCISKVTTASLSYLGCQMFAYGAYRNSVICDHKDCKPVDVSYSPCKLDECKVMCDAMLPSGDAWVCKTACDEYGQLWISDKLADPLAEQEEVLLNNLDQEKKNAHLLTQATFGPTRADMAVLRSGTSKSDWVKSQLAMPMETHREYFRKQANPLVEGGKSSRFSFRGPCSPGSRWAKYRVVADNSSGQEAALNVMESGKFAILQRGFNTCPFSKRSEDLPVANEGGHLCPNGSSYIDDELICRMETQRYLSMVGTLPGVFKTEKNCQHSYGCQYSASTGHVFLNECAPGGEKEKTVKASSGGDKRDRICGLDRELRVTAHGFEWVHETRLKLENNLPSSPKSGKHCVQRSPINEGSCRFDDVCGMTCGSPGEVANDPRLGYHLGFKTHLKLDLNYDDAYRSDQPEADITRYSAKSLVWVMKAVRAKDQVRQRMAWALSQICVVGSGLELQDPELWLNFYDIMVRNAFGNYRDVLREATYSPVMGKYLTHTGSSSFDYNGFYPNENYPREIMQLFSVGLVVLNEDGNPKLNDDDEVIETYGNENILSHSRAFTGFMNQATRGNIERTGENYIDPMYMDAEQHDFHPKVSLAGGYIGDGLPLCSKFEGQVGSFAKGTRFELQTDGEAKGTKLAKHLELFKALCGSDSGAPPCSEPKVWTEIQEERPCKNRECDEIVEVVGQTFRRIPPRCQSPYVQGATKITVDRAGELVIGEGNKKHSLFVYWDGAAPGAGEYDVAVQDNLVKFPGGQAFRNPPVFYVKGRDAEGKALRAAIDEVEEVLDHLFDHENTPVYVAARLIQRFGMSTPAAGYMRAVGDAFRTGKYEEDIGSGQRGDLEATAAAILLADDAYKPGQSPDTHASLREPFLKIVHVLRSLEYTQIDAEFEHEKISFTFLASLIGQFPFESPSVFNFFQADYELPTATIDMPVEKQPEPESEEEEEGEEEEKEEEEEMMARAPKKMMAPELQILTPIFMMGYLNVMSTVLTVGVNHESCHTYMKDAAIVGTPTSDFGRTQCGGSWGLDSHITDLDLLLTGGRLSATNRQIARTAYSDTRRRQAHMVRAAAKYVVLTTEFNSLGEPEPVQGETRPFPDVENKDKAAARSYKAMVMVYMSGGADTYNLIVPQHCDMNDDYHTVRGDIAMKPDELIPVTSVGQNCSKWGVHHRMSILQQEYLEGRAAFVADIGHIIFPSGWKNKQGGPHWACSRMQSHSDQARMAQQVSCNGGDGIGGRIAAALFQAAPKVSPPWQVASWSASGSNTFGKSATVKMEVVGTGVQHFREYEKWKTELHNITMQVHANPYSNVYTLALMDTLVVPLSVGPLLEGNGNLKTDWGPDCEENLCAQFKTVAKLIGARGDRGAERDIFYTNQDGYDHHGFVKEKLDTLWTELNDALTFFVVEMKAQDAWDKVVLFSSSEFARTLSGNGRAGSDHGASGNHFFMSGALQGGKIFNEFPSAMMYKKQPRRNMGRAGLAPKHPWENMFVPLALWMGVPAGQLDIMFPILRNFEKVKDEYIIKQQDLFKPGA